MVLLSMALKEKSGALIEIFRRDSRSVVQSFRTQYAKQC